MSNALLRYQELQQKEKKIQEELEKLRKDDRFQHELEFSEKLEALLVEYGKTSKEVIQLLDPTFYDSTTPKTSRKRSLRIYTNPHTKEKVETYGGNHKVIRSWKEQYGEEEVLSWMKIAE